MSCCMRMGRWRRSSDPKSLDWQKRFHEGRVDKKHKGADILPVVDHCSRDRQDRRNTGSAGSVCWRSRNRGNLD